jgi:uncharacterized membrane protein YeaQ/YmgE (transglycosylase-associated protein family)
MDIAMWLVVGAIVGWLGFSLTGLNEKRGLLVSILVGATGAFLGGKIFAPMLGAAPAVAGDLSMASVAVTAVAAGAFLAAGDFIQQRWGV